MDKQTTKGPLQSKTIVAAIAIFIVAISSLFNIDISDGDAQEIAQAGVSIVTAVLSLVAIYGRYVARQKID